jgi:membrane-associated phospholipid phosphatase
MTPDQLVYSLPTADTHVDRYLKWLPAITVMGSRPAGLRTAHVMWQQCVLLGVSTLLMKAATQGLKYSVHRSRPLFPLDGQSFPSSHSSTAFAGAELLRRELHDGYPVLSWSGYVPAVATAMLRLGKRRHWPSDVLAGALIGIGAVWLTGKIADKVQSQTSPPSSTP